MIYPRLQLSTGPMASANTQFDPPEIEPPIPLPSIGFPHHKKSIRMQQHAAEYRQRAKCDRTVRGRSPISFAARENSEVYKAPEIPGEVALLIDLPCKK